jgi:galactokinase
MLRDAGRFELSRRDGHAELPRPSFADRFGRAPDVVARAPGRVNLIGEHTDYSGGFVLPMAIPLETTVEIALREDRRVRAFSADVRRGEIAEYQLGSEARGGSWLDYVQGVTWALAGSHPLEAGFDLRVATEIPLGSGLSSSAALEVALLRGLREALGLGLSDLEIALLGRRAENDLVGAPVGIMDQVASSLADERTALFLDTRSLSYERIPFPPGVDLVVIDSGFSHGHAGGEYRTRRAECERAAALLGVPELRDAGPGEERRLMDLPEPLGRRARHVVSENARVLQAASALRANDPEHLGALFYASHQSMRDDYEISIPEIDLLVELARADTQVIGARLTGGGFGGSVVMLARGGEGAAAARRIAAAYAARTGGSPAVLLPPARSTEESS